MVWFWIFTSISLKYTVILLISVLSCFVWSTCNFATKMYPGEQRVQGVFCSQPYTICSPEYSRVFTRTETCSQLQNTPFLCLLNILLYSSAGFSSGNVLNFLINTLDKTRILWWGTQNELASGKFKIVSNIVLNWIKKSTII